MYRATNMKQYAHLLLAILVLHAHAAIIPEQIQPEVEKELINDDIKSPIENISSEQVLIDQSNTIKDVQNDLRKSAAEGVPVEVILVEVLPTQKTNIDKEIVNEVSDEEIHRPVIDLKNPGPPQRQEHETQNPEHYEDAERTAISVGEDIRETQTLLKQGLQGVTDGIQNWYVNNEQINNIQVSLQNMQENFKTQIQKLNESVQNFLNPDKSNPAVSEKELSVIKANYEQIESRLKILQNNFNNGVKTLSEGVDIVATLRDESVPASSEAPASSSTTTSSPSGPFVGIINFFSNFQNSVTESFANLGQAISNAITPNQNQGGSSPASPLSDTAAGSSTTAKPSNWPNFQSPFTNFLNLNQGAQASQGGQPAQTGPFGLIQSSPFVQNFVSLFQPNRPSTSTQESSTTASVSKPSNKPTETKPEPEKKPEAEKIPEPEKKSEQNSPIVKGLSGVAQTLQDTINKTEKPKEIEGNNETEQEKGGLLFLAGHGGHGGHGGGNGKRRQTYHF